MSKNIKTLYRLAWAAVVALCVIGALVMFAPQLNRQGKLQKDKVARETEDRRLNEEISDLQGRQQAFQTDPRFVERTAREMGMVRPDEFILKPAHETRDPK